MNLAPIVGLTPRALHAYLRLPDADHAIPRIRIDHALGVGPSSVTRYLQELSASGLLLRVAHGSYAVPRNPVRRLLLTEPDPYHREVLLLDDAHRDQPERAFACLPVRDALSMQLPHAILVLPPEAARVDQPPQVAHMRLSDEPNIREVPVPSDASPAVAFTRVRCAAAVDALALLASTGDADFVHAAKQTAPRLGTSVKAVAAAVRRLKVAPDDPGPADAPHLVRHPAWLQDRIRAAGITALRRTTRAVLEAEDAA